MSSHDEQDEQLHRQHFHDEHIRVSCAILCRFWVGANLLFLLNRNRRAQGIYELSPLGGAIEADPESPIFTQLHLQPESPASHDLRFFIRRAQLPVFAAWFSKRQSRETSPFRELREELVEEAGLLPQLVPADVEWRFLYTYENEQTTQREGVSGILTHYFLEVFEVRVLNPAVEKYLLAAQPDSGAMLVDEPTARQATTFTMMVDGMIRTVQLNASSLFQDQA